MHTTVRKIRLHATVGLLLAAVACQRGPTAPADVAASISGEQILYRQFEASFRDSVDDDVLPFGADVQSRLFDQFLDGQLLIRWAIERGMEVGGEPGAAERRAVAFLLRASPPGEPTAAEVAAWYETHREDFLRPEEVHLRQILVHEPGQAEAARKELARGEDFAQVAARFSQGPRALQGGDQGRLAYEDLPLDFRDTIFELATGEISDVVTTYYGYLIFQVVERFPAREAPLDDVEDEIRQALQRAKVDDQVRSFVLEARARYNVEIFPENFPFPYQGAYAKSAK